jgi:hypothetical protein
MVMKNSISNRYVASVMAPGPDLGGALQVYQGWKPCIDWCEKQWGNQGRWWFIGEGVFEFTEELDYTWFMLRWS